MQLTTHTDYALRLLIYLMSHRSRKVSTREVAEAYAISLHHLAKVAKLRQIWSHWTTHERASEAQFKPLVEEGKDEAKIYK